MRVLYLTKYGPKAATTRYRMLQFLPYLESKGISCELSPLLEDDYLKTLFSGGKFPASKIIGLYLKRLQQLLTLRKFDLVVIQYELLPYFPSFLEKLLRLANVPFLYDFDDAVFHRYDEHPNRWVKSILGKKIANIIGSAKGVMAGNQYLADYASHYNSHVSIFPTVVDSSRYAKKEYELDSTRPFTIGWIGSPSTAAYLKPLEEPLKRFLADKNGQCLAIGAGDLPVGSVFTSIPWSEEAELQQLSQFDVGIMPLPEENWARGKCGFKLIQYMAAKLPVIASPVGVNQEIVEQGKTGFLATTEAEWLEALEILYREKELRRYMAEEGLKRVEAHYDYSVMAPRLKDYLEWAVQ